MRRPETTRRYLLKKRYKLTETTYDEILFIQGSKCAICKSSSSKDKRAKRLFVDHNHETGKIRGLLCNACNRGLGCFEDSVHLLQNAKEYLDERR